MYSMRIKDGIGWNLPLGVRRAGVRVEGGEGAGHGAWGDQVLAFFLVDLGLVGVPVDEQVAINLSQERNERLISLNEPLD